MLKKKTLKKIFSVCLSVVVIICVCVYFYIRNRNLKNEKNLLSLADNIISEEIVTPKADGTTISGSEDYLEENNSEEKELFSAEKIEQDANVLGKIKIKKIGVEAPIMDGTSQDVLRMSVGHFKRTNYWNGNVALASHNRGSYAHYFKNINKLDIGDEITYQTKLGTRIYQVSEIEEISENDLSVLEGTESNTITLITCIVNKSNLRLCVRGIEKI